MIYDLTYQPADTTNVQEPVSLRWVAEGWWTPKAIIADFERRFPGSRVVSLEPAGVAA
jgi:hypothetical protein